jgi:hypothetical protein
VVDVASCGPVLRHCGQQIRVGRGDGKDQVERPVLIAFDTLLMYGIQKIVVLGTKLLPAL